MLPAGARMPAAGDLLDIRCGDFVTGATVLAIDLAADTIVLQFHASGSQTTVPLSAAISVDWYPNGGQA